MFNPLPASEWSVRTAAHLINRAGFGGSPADAQAIYERGLEGAVSFFIDYDSIPDATPPPDWAHLDPDLLTRREAIKNASDPEMRKMLLKEERTTEYSQITDLRYWWLRRMALGPRPLQEKMTLFWHGHFATSFEKVRTPFFLWQQNEVFRQNALTDFPSLLTAVSKDPAMLVYLDGALSHTPHPNENFAREVMELFTLGIGNYTEKDIQEAARAYTGWSLGKDRQSFQYRPFFHDSGSKTFLGQTGDFTGEDCLKIICQQPACAHFISWKLWKFFAQDNPPKATVDALAKIFQQVNLDLKKVLRILFSSQEFYAPNVVHNQIKSPVQWLISAVREMQTDLPTRPMSLVMLYTLGQELFQPPNVKGWDGGYSWVTTNTLLNRYNFAAALVEGERVPLPNLRGAMRGMLNNLGDQGLLQVVPLNVSPLFSSDELTHPDQLLSAMEARFLHVPLKAERRNSLLTFLQQKSPLQEGDIRKGIRLLMSTPEYQLT